MKTDGVWGAIGRTAAWPDEENPPEVDVMAHAIDTPIVYARPANMSLAKVVTTGEDFTFNGVKYAYVADVDAYTQAARFLFMQFEFDPSEGPYAAFRQDGVYADLVPAVGHESDLWLAPANVSDDGILMWSANHEVVSFTEFEIRGFRTVIEFK